MAELSSYCFDSQNKLASIKELLVKIGMPRRQQNELCCYSLLALLQLKPKDEWQTASNVWIRIHDMIIFMNDSYGTTYAENTRESIRKDAMHHFRNAAIIEDNGKATNSPAYRYRVTDEFLKVVQNLSANTHFLDTFISIHESLIEQYSSKKVIQRMPVKINGIDLSFSPGRHNQLQKAIIEQFAPRFAPNSECLYVGDSDNRDLHKDVNKLSQLGFEITLHDKMPDVVLYREEKDWIYFIEAVDSVGPMNPKRIIEISEMTKNVTSGKIFVTAFLDKIVFKKFVAELAWETEVWIAEAPDHMVHLNGDKFLGPHSENQSL